MQGISEISCQPFAPTADGVRDAVQPTVISSEDLKALLYLTIRGDNGLTAREKQNEEEHIDIEKGVDIKA